jgi:aerobic-type carbon monoxide dehydrogenase small subunit (CoxS/CutS family)
LRGSDFSAEPRAGFCLMGACQDCWVRLGDGRRVRACSTLLEAGQHISREPGRCV